MAVTVTGNLKAAWRFAFTGDTGFFSGVARDLVDTLSTVFTSGTAADQVNRIGVISKALSSSTPDSIDLTSLTDPNGGSFTDMDLVRLLILWNTSTTDAAYTIVGADATNGWSSGFVNSADGEGAVLRSSSTANSSMLILAAPHTTGLAVSGTNKVITLTPSAHAQTINGLVFGAAV